MAGDRSTGDQSLAVVTIRSYYKTTLCRVSKQPLKLKILNCTMIQCKIYIMKSFFSHPDLLYLYNMLSTLKDLYSEFEYCLSGCLLHSWLGNRSGSLGPFPYSRIIPFLCSTTSLCFFLVLRFRSVSSNPRELITSARSDRSIKVGFLL